jgi:hypothetical protein
MIKPVEEILGRGTVFPIIVILAQVAAMTMLEINHFKKVPLVHHLSHLLRWYSVVEYGK